MITRHTIPQKLWAGVRSRQAWQAAGVVAVLTGIVLLVTLLTPYKAPQQSYFYDAGDQSPSTTYLRATIIEVTDDAWLVTLRDGPQTGAMVEVQVPTDATRPVLSVDDSIVVGQLGQDASFQFIDTVRLGALAVVVAVFVGAVMLIGRRRGAMSLVGLGVSVVIIGWYIVPLIVAGHSAFWVSISGAYLIAVSSIFIAHGVRRRTVISVVCIAAILAVVVLMALAAVSLTSLSGLSSEAAYYLAMDMEQLNMQGILIGGIVIATLGVLDDIVTAQVAAVEELHKANPKFTRRQLYSSAASVGSEHIASLVNTLALAYAGASLPIIIQLVQSSGVSTFLLFNGEYIATEVVRTVVASTGLVLAVPIATLTATMVYKRLVQ